MPFTPYKSSTLPASSSGFKPYRPISSSSMDTGFPDKEPPVTQESFLKKLGGALISSERTFGKATSTLFDKTSQKTAADTAAMAGKDQQSLIQAIHNQSNPVKKVHLIDALKKVYGVDFKSTTAEELNPGFATTNKELAGSAIGVATDIASFGSYGKAAKGAESFKLLQQAPKVAPIVDVTSKIAKPTTVEKLTAFGKGFIKGGVKAAPIGVAYGTSGALQENKDTKDIIKSGIQGGVINAVFGGLLEGKANLKAETAPYKAQQLHEKAVAQYKLGLGATKEKYKELSDKIIPDLLKDKKWGTRSGLLKDALNGIKLSEDQYNELGKLQGVAEIDGILGKIDDEMAKLKTPAGNILSTETGKYQALKGLQQDITDYILNDQVSKAGGPVAAQQSLRELAQNYGSTLYETRKALKTVSDSKTLSQVQMVDGAIRNLLNTNNPTYEAINKVYTANNRLADILNETAQRESTGLSTRRLIEIVSSIGGLVTGGTVGAVTGGGTGAAVGSLIGSAGIAGLSTMLESTWYNTLRAVQKEKVAQKLLELDPEKRNQLLIILGQQGAKYAHQLGLY